MGTKAVYLNNKYLTKICLIILIGALSMATGCGMKRAKYTFAVVSDIQYSSAGTPGLEKNLQSLDTLQRTIDHYNGKEMIDSASYIGYARKPSFIVQLGDAIEGGENANADLDKVLGVLDNAKAKKYHVLGNHDFFGLSRDVTLKKLGMKKAYYDFTKGKIRFVVLDTNDISIMGGWDISSSNYRSAADMLERLKQQGTANAMEYNGAVGPDQKQWLKKVLAGAQKKKQKVVVFAHHPLVPEGDKYCLWNAGEITDILESYNCVVAYINGHRHKNSYQWQNGVCYVTLEGLVESEDNIVYAVVWVYSDRLMIESTAQTPRLMIPLNR